MAKCPQCGGEMVFSKTRLRDVCTCCGCEAADEAFERNYARARANLSSGRWDEAIGILSGLLHSYPNEKQLHAAILRAATQDYQDLACDNSYRRDAASNAWDSLRRLGMKPEVLQYGRRKRAARRQALCRERTISVSWLFGAAICGLCSGITLETGPWYLPVLLQIGFYYGLYRFVKSRPLSIIRKLLVQTTDYDNPFALEKEDLTR